jgi:riboflavin kinase/FMN adenylyltransferase
MKNNITSITIGGFDGMHIAHQELFKYLDINGAILVIETGYATLTPKTYRQYYTSYPLYYYNLNNIKHLSGKEFISLLKQEYPKLKTIIVGFDFKFGKNATCNIDDLKDLFNKKVIVVDEFLYDNIAVHSRTIRDFISNGDIKKANKLLNRNYSISGIHIKGQGIGAKQLVPTINISCDDFLIPQNGVYSTYSFIDDIKYKSITFIGHKVSTNNKYSIETHIIDQNIIKKISKIKIEFIKKIRDNKKFDNLEDLKNQIKKDISIVL